MTTRGGSVALEVGRRRASNRVWRVFTAGASALLAVPATGQVIDEDLKIRASDTLAGDLFGNSVAMSGGTAIVGAPLDGDLGMGAGSSYLFDTVTGNQTATLTALDTAPGDRFGRSVAISGTTAIVGAWGSDAAGEDAGSAYLFDTVTGLQIGRLTADDAAAQDWFGFSVAISGAVAVVGAMGDDDAGAESGSAYLFDLTEGEQIAKLTASDAEPGERFGMCVAVSGTTVIVGSSLDDDAGDGSGAAYLFDAVSGEQIAKLTADDAAPGDGFGYSVAIDGTTAIIGATREFGMGQGARSAYLFDTTTGTQIAKLTVDDPLSHYFGASVGISGPFTVVGAFWDRHAGAGSGSAYLFDATTGDPIVKFIASDATWYDQFGFAVGVSDGMAIVGAFGDDAETGSAYLFEIPVPCNAADFSFEFDRLDLSDIVAFLVSFTTLDPDADLNDDGSIDLADINAFVDAFLAGCP